MWPVRGGVEVGELSSIWVRHWKVFGKCCAHVVVLGVSGVRYPSPPSNSFHLLASSQSQYERNEHSSRHSWLCRERHNQCSQNRAWNCQVLIKQADGMDFSQINIYNDVGDRAISDAVIPLVPNPSPRFTGRADIIAKLREYFSANANDGVQKRK